MKNIYHRLHQQVWIYKLSPWFINLNLQVKARHWQTNIAYQIGIVYRQHECRSSSSHIYHQWTITYEVAEIWWPSPDQIKACLKKAPTGQHHITNPPFINILNSSQLDRWVISPTSQAHQWTGTWPCSRPAGMEHVSHQRCNKQTGPQNSKHNPRN